MGFREPLDISSFLAVQQAQMQPPRPRRLVPPTDPYPVGAGVLTISASLEMERWPSVVWDVNAYYLELGVGFRATRKQMGAAYYARNGHGSERLTYIFRQLLNTAVRRAYDAVPLGETFIDRYFIDALKHKAIARAQELNDLGFEATAEEILEDMVMTLKGGPDLDIPQKVGDDSLTPSHTGSAPAGPPDPPNPAGDVTWPYAYYLLGMQEWEQPMTTRLTMRLWQEALVAECERQGIKASFGVGLMSAGRGAKVLSVEGVNVALVSMESSEPIEDLAALIAKQLV